MAGRVTTGRWASQARAVRAQRPGVEVRRSLCGAGHGTRRPATGRMTALRSSAGVEATQLGASTASISEHEPEPAPRAAGANSRAKMPTAASQRLSP